MHILNKTYVLPHFAGRKKNIDEKGKNTSFGEKDVESGIFLQSKITNTPGRNITGQETNQKNLSSSNLYNSQRLKYSGLEGVKKK
jgi:hypothetical protein